MKPKKPRLRKAKNCGNCAYILGYYGFKTACNKHDREITGNEYDAVCDSHRFERVKKCS